METEINGSYGMVKIREGLAIKYISAQHFDTFVAEVAVLALSGTNMPKLVDFGTTVGDGDINFITMTSHGISLSEKIKADGPLGVDLSCVIVHDILLAVAFLHTNKIIHGDVKPDNVIVEGGHARLIDFGLSRSSEDLMYDSVIQTPTYRAPEVDYYKDRCRYTRAIDIFSVGCCAFEMVSGRVFLRVGAEPHEPIYNDTTMSLCNALGIPICGDRSDRMRTLEQLSAATVTAVVMRLRDKYMPEFTGDKCTFFLALVAKCVSARKIRPTSSKCLDFMQAKLGMRCYEKVPPTVKSLAIPEEGAQDKLKLACEGMVLAEIISACERGVLEHAGRLYAAIGKSDVEDIFSCLYIAASIHGGESWMLKALENICVMTPHAREKIIKVLAELNGRAYL